MPDVATLSADDVRRLVLEESWRTVPSSLGYSVSSWGRVRSERRIVRSKNGTDRPHPSQLLRQCQTARRGGSGYPTVQLGRGNMRMVHQIVCEAFLGRCPAGHETNHRDGNKSNNRLDNLEYLTQAENNRHAIATGLHKITRDSNGRFTTNKR